MWYNIDFNRLVILLLPINWRKSGMTAFMQSLIAPVKELHYQFLQNRKRNVYRIGHNWMKVYMQAALNDEFDPQLRRIVIDEPDLEGNYIYTAVENKPRYLSKMYLRTSWESSDSGFDFTVNMNMVQADKYDVAAMVDFYRLFGTRYNMINFGLSVGTP